LQNLKKIYLKKQNKIKKQINKINNKNTTNKDIHNHGNDKTNNNLKKNKEKRFINEK